MAKKTPKPEQPLIRMAGSAIDGDIGEMAHRAAKSNPDGTRTPIKTRAAAKIVKPKWKKRPHEANATTTHGKKRRYEANAATTDGKKGRHEADATTTDGKKGRHEANATTTHGKKRRYEADAITTHGKKRRHESNATTTDVKMSSKASAEETNQLGLFTTGHFSKVLSPRICVLDAKKVIELFPEHTDDILVNFKAERQPVLQELLSDYLKHRPRLTYRTFNESIGSGKVTGKAKEAGKAYKGSAREEICEAESAASLLNKKALKRTQQMLFEDKIKGKKIPDKDTLKMIVNDVKREPPNKKTSKGARILNGVTRFVKMISKNEFDPQVIQELRKSAVGIA